MMMMASMMDTMLIDVGGGVGDVGDVGDGTRKDDVNADEDADEDADDENEYSGRPTRNDNPNALNGVDPYYAMPQEVLPVFFEPTPTAAMIAAKKSFLNRQGWQMATLSPRE